MEPMTNPSPIPASENGANAPPAPGSASGSAFGRSRAMMATGALVTALLIGGVTSVLAASPSPSSSGNGSSGGAAASAAPSQPCDHAPGSSSSSGSTSSSS